ncbi:MAG: hypothetical protein B7Z63_05600 [Ignavibacteriae bacterium 37-53-5]|nr:MAG: hypothetical protein B7Z63_05600 [Ignavibacteriae bacterium 37-53-5]
MNIGKVARLLSGSRAGFQSLEHIDAADDFFSGIFSSDQGADQIKNQLVTKIYDGVVIEPNPFAHVLMSMSAGPFLMSRQVGTGFAFVVVSGADTASSNFPLSPFFPVVIQRALFYSAAVRYKPSQILAGQRLSVNVNPRESDLAQSSTSRIEGFARELGFAPENVFVVKADKNAVASIDRLRRGEDLSSIFAASALLLLIAEIFVSRMKTI